MNVSQICHHKPRSDTIQAGMAQRSQRTKRVDFKSAKNELAIETQFVSIWFVVEVLCMGNFIGYSNFAKKIN